jgi:hypothetical protein
MDGTWREIGVFPAASGGSLRLSLCVAPPAGGGAARGQQQLELLDAAGARTAVIQLDLEFSLTSAGRMVELAAAAGFSCAGLLGDYEGAPFDEATSPVIVATFVKPV